MHSLNGWATSSRMHEEVVLDCLLGCGDCKDSLDHYVHCPHLYAFLRYFFEGYSSDPLIRFGLKSPSPSSFKVMCCVFSAYHALKGKIRAGQIKMQRDSETKVLLRQAWSVFADALAAEAGECQLSHYASSLPKFIVFFNSGGAHRNDGSSQSSQIDIRHVDVHEDSQ